MLDILSTDNITFWGLSYAFVELLGVLSSFHAVDRVKSSQTAIAWCLGLLIMPLVSLPLYWVFGQRRFYGYVKLHRFKAQKIAQMKAQLGIDFKSSFPSGARSKEQIFETFSSLPFTQNNQIDLLIDGRATFESIFKAIKAAKSYVIVQSYIIRDDKLGQDLKSLLIERAQSDVKVYVLYDEVGSYGLSYSYIRDLKSVRGIEIEGFRTTKGILNPFQMNFRNHRKTIIIDGETAFVGGHNVGDEYLGKNPKLSPWRDTHVRIRGSAVMCIQLTFLEDWYWATDNQVLPLLWGSERARSPETPTEPLQNHLDRNKSCEEARSVKSQASRNQVLIIPSGPADEFETCHLFFISLLNFAKDKVLLATPYFIPDQAFMKAIHLAVLRGVEIRVLIPKNFESRWLRWATEHFANEVSQYGVQVFMYEKGFMHQKVICVDGEISCVGTANIDNRSFRMNFEMSVLVLEENFSYEVSQMLEEDLRKSVLYTPPFTQNFFSALPVNIARLLAPLL